MQCVNVVSPTLLRAVVNVMRTHMMEIYIMVSIVDSSINTITQT